MANFFIENYLRLQFAETSDQHPQKMPLETYTKLRVPIAKNTPEGMSSIQQIALPDIRGPLYRVTMDRASFIVAAYSNEIILWLDNHLNDDDFEAFIQREGLVAWIPENPDLLARVLVNTKLAYLSGPEVIHSVVDIPFPAIPPNVPEEDLTDIAKVLGEMKNRLTNISEKIHPPRYEIVQDRTYLRFAVWTRLYGNIFDIECLFTGIDKFGYRGVQLASEVGHWLPRV